jgi:LacI family transcriptional regulator
MKHRSGRTTIREVASAAGVSTQTVSRVINNRPDVSSETRKRVQKIIDQLGYRPSALARSLISQRSYTLGVVTAGLKYVGPSRTLSGITRAAEKAGYSLLLNELPNFAANNIEPIFQRLLSRHVDGIIWAVPEVADNRDWIGDLPPNLEVPIVFLAMEPVKGVSVVSIDNYQGGRVATSHLLEQGYRNIGHISGPLDWWEARQRKAGWADVLKEAGIDTDARHWTEGNWSAKSGNHAIKALMERYPEMDAIFIANDQMALGVIQFSCQSGVSIPEDLGIVGFDNIPESAYFWPPLTTVDQDQYKVGEVAVNEIIAKIENDQEGDEPHQTKPTMLNTNLIIRQSSIRSTNKGGVTG